jgi:ATP-dependent RNA helicase DDX24/MAK5
VDHTVLQPLKQRLQLAVDIEKASHVNDKKQHEANWFRKTAAAMDIELDDDLLSSDEEDQQDRSSRHRKKQKTVSTSDIGAMKRNLEAMLKQPLMPRGISVIYYLN